MPLHIGHWLHGRNKVGVGKGTNWQLRVLAAHTHGGWGTVLTQRPVHVPLDAPQPALCWPSLFHPGRGAKLQGSVVTLPSSVYSGFLVI